MAKSPVGGSRAYLKGRIGSDVYSLGKDGKGKRQQVVRALAEQVSNPRSQSQMVGRMIMSTVMQAAKALGAIIDHSFDNVPVGQPSVSEFIRRNYAALKAGTGVYNAYQEKGAKANAYVVSQGKAQWPAGMQTGQCQDDELTLFGMYGAWFDTKAENMTVGELRALLQTGSADDYFTLINGANFDISRFSVNPALSDDANIYDWTEVKPLADLFVVDSNSGKGTWTIEDNATGEGHNLVICFRNQGSSIDAENFGAIVSRKVNGKWQHSSCTLHAPVNATPNYATALATYPTGAEMFLNGGDL